MDEPQLLAERFEEHRPHMRAVAYRMLGSINEADDAVQETWLRFSRDDRSSVENLGGWLTTVVSRVCLNMLRSRETRREEPLEVHVPDPVVSRPDASDPEHEVQSTRVTAVSPSMRLGGAPLGVGRGGAVARGATIGTCR